MTTFETILLVQSIVDTFFLILIWRDGRKILKVELATHELYGEYITYQKELRHAKLEQLAQARAAKAAKKGLGESPNQESIART